ncbi:MAG TPA: DNA repair protein RecN [Ignavibacteria bacterium]|nr:DNA repair protein RecN [Ignavibacteria bacterium]
MIESLYIRNYLIIKEAEISLNKGLNILTGETGAGKSIILDALSLILGERADYSKIKKDEDKLIVEGHFNFKENKEINKLLSDILPDEDVNQESIILRRELLKKGVSRNFINDSPVNISDMKKFGDIIIDIHSQNEHQSLLNRETHIEILDNYSMDEDSFKNYRFEFNKLRDIIKEHNDLALKKDDLISRKNIIDFELKELNNINISSGEDSDLENELNRLENTEEISMGVETALNALYEEDINAGNLLKTAIKDLKKIAAYDTYLEKIIADLESSYILIKESTDSLNSYRDRLNFDNERIEQVRNRLSDINHLKKKYGMSTDELILKSESLQKELLFADNFDYELEKLLNKINEQKAVVLKSVLKISDIRKKGSKELEKQINLVLKEVGLEGAEFNVKLNSIAGEKEDIHSVKSGKDFIKPGIKGMDNIEFVIKINKGTDFTPLHKSASGGEISRIMLAIKAVISEKDKIGILVFDEIDAGISGRIAQKVGKVLKTLSKTHQIICITHLPQIAAMSDRHFHVSKKEDKKETLAAIRDLNEEEKLLEVAKLISGEKVTEAAKKSALELIKS